MTYKIETEYLEHDGGTKFYETVLIKEEGGPGLLVKRYGSIDKKMGGGQTLIERGSHSVVGASAQKILNEKRKPRAGKGQYVNKARPLFGLNKVGIGTVDATALETYVTEHFSRTDATAIKDYFGVRNGAVVKEEPAVVPEEPVIRDATWGSW